MIVVKGNVDCPFFIPTKKDYYSFTITPPHDNYDPEECHLNIEEVINVNANELELSLFSLLLASKGIDLTQFKPTRKYYFYNKLSPRHEFFKAITNSGGFLMVVFRSKYYIIPLWVEFQYRMVGTKEYFPPAPKEHSVPLNKSRVLFLSSSETALNYINSRFGDYKYTHSEHFIGIGKQSWVSRTKELAVYNNFNPESKFLLQLVFCTECTGDIFHGWASLDKEDCGFLTFNPLLLATKNKTFSLSQFDILDLISVRKSFKKQFFNTKSRDYRFLQYLNKGLIVLALNPEFGVNLMKI